MASENIKYIVMAFVCLILGAALVGTVATNTNAVNDKLGISGEAIDISASVVGGQVNESLSNFTVINYPTSWKIEDCPLSLMTYGNSTVDYVLNTDYELFLDGGKIHVLNTTTTENGGNDTLTSYTYCGDDYLNLSWGRSILSMVAGFFALALLGASLWMFYRIFQSTGLMK